MRALALVMLLSTGCDRPELAVGEGCDLNSDCPEPLACGLDRCRRQCVDSRDCGAGLRCLLVENEGGLCQLPEEASCALDSDCPERLVCHFGTCTTACAEDRDCADGATCTDVSDGSKACEEPRNDLCVYNSDCPEPMVCTERQLCSLECRELRDCPNPRVCIDSLCELP